MPSYVPLPLPQIVAEFAKHAPIERLKCNSRFWEGVLSMQPLIRELETLLPPNFAELQQGGLPEWLACGRDDSCSRQCLHGWRTCGGLRCL